MKISLCLIVWNEFQGCLLDIPQLPLNDFFEVFAIDGGSTDGTVEYLKQAGIPVYPQKKKGLNAAYIQANETAQGDAIISFFPKGTITISALKIIKDYLFKGYDLVIASRQIKGSCNEEDSHIIKPRKWSVFGLGLMVSLIWRREGRLIRDVLHGVKGWKKDAFQRMNILDHGLSIDLEMVVRSYKLKLNRIEIPINECARQYGETRFKYWNTGMLLLNYLLYEIRREN